MRTVIAIGTVVLGMVGTISIAEGGHGGFGGHFGGGGGGPFGGGHFGGAHFATRSVSGVSRVSRLGPVRYYNHVGSSYSRGAHIAHNGISHHQSFAHSQQLSALHNSERLNGVRNLNQAAPGQFAHA